MCIIWDAQFELFVYFGTWICTLCRVWNDFSVFVPNVPKWVFQAVHAIDTTCVKFVRFFLCSIYANSVICFANNLYVVVTGNFSYKMCFFADVGKGSPFISRTFFFDETFNSLLPIKTFCVVWTDCSWNIGFLVDCSLLRGYFLFPPNV